MDGVTAWVDGMAVGIGRHRLLRVAEASVAQPFPLSEGPVEGIATVDGLPVLQLSLGELVGRAQPPGGKLVVVAMPCGRLALRAEAVTPGLPAGDPDRLDEMVAAAIPWPEPPSLPFPTTPGSPWVDRRRRLAVLFATHNGLRLALPANAIQSVEWIDAWWPRTDGTDGFLLLLGYRLMAGRGLTDDAGQGGAAGRYALLPRGERPVLTADATDGVRRVSCRDIHAAHHPDGKMSWWIAEKNRAPVRLLTLDGPAETLDADESAGRRRPTSRPIVVLARYATVRFTLPVSLVSAVLPAPVDGPILRPPRVAALFGRSATPRYLLEIAGQRSRLLPVDEVRLVRLPDPSSWVPLPACPPAIGKRFRAMGRIGEDWVLVSRRHRLADPG